ncbi:hypothetical protein KIN20_014945 [Parelaphostrongylus tenuis]|uniref:WASH complex subunit 7 n=1 Tax=Parelaphostrongylus tenuis TaxID=148309 RepID=A0AAD5ME62_PARTN|nr:hypothetical protein KIN20_014945 [Parelaphostrongylus tenuis]
MGRLNSSQLDALISRLETFCKMDAIIERVSDCSFLVFHRDLTVIYWDTALSRLPTRQDITHFTMAMSDCIRYVEKSGRSKQLERFREEMVQSIEKLRFDLRVLSHQDLIDDERGKPSQEVLDFYKRMLCNPDIRLHGVNLSHPIFKRCFYELTALSLHDRHAYAKMSMLAEQRYGLDIIDGALPNYSTGMSMDVVQVMRSLKQFVADFNYCLHQERFLHTVSIQLSSFFIEKTSPNRTLRVLTADHMADSMRTHGLGVLNTGVNLTYQLLRSKFTVFNQFLKDEHIHAQLQKDIRYFRENMDSLNKMFPPKRAELFNRALSQLTTQQNECTYMDKFRILITQMGNALGFVRSMSSAAAAVASQMKAYDTVVEDIGPPDPNDDSPIRITMELLRELREHASKTRSFIKMLVEVFRSAFLDESRFGHLLDFYVAVPALTVNYVEHMLMCRDRLKKRTQHDKELTFTDDGFTMGLAYILTILKLWPQFTALNWFRSVNKKCAADKEVLNEEMKTSKDPRSANLRATRLQAYEREFKLLSFTFQSSRVFFSVDDDEE